MNEVSKSMESLSASAPTVVGRTPRDDVKYLRAALVPDADGKINEEQLFAGIVEERIKVRRGGEMAGRFRALFDAARASMGRTANAIENSARRALNALTQEGQLSATEAVTIHSEAFAAAQLDAEEESLFDSIGSRRDKTVARKEVDAAVAGAIARLNDLDAGRSTSKRRPVLEVKYQAGGIGQNR